MSLSFDCIKWLSYPQDDQARLSQWKKRCLWLRLAIVLSRIAQVIHRPGGVGESVLATVATLHLYDLSTESMVLSL